jgi:hypothetical protein
MIQENKITKIDGFVLDLLDTTIITRNWLHSNDVASTIFNLNPAFQKNVSPDILQAIDDAKRNDDKDEDLNIIRILSIAIIKKVLTEGLMRIGEASFPEFEPWPLTIEESLNRVETEFYKLKENFHDEPTYWLGDIYWLESTSYGDEMGEKAFLQREKWCEEHPDYDGDWIKPMGK